MGKLFKREEERQIYTFIRNLGSYISSVDELGMLVGYSTIHSLAGFESNTGSVEERQFQQVKAVHNGLELLLKESANKDSYVVLCNLQITTDPVLTELLKNPQAYTGQSDLLAMALKRFASNSRDYRDKIRRHGTAICEKSKQKGIVYGTKNILTTDYGTIQYAFR